jgi:Flp pilus assembly protein TadD
VLVLLSGFIFLAVHFRAELIGFKNGFLKEPVNKVAPLAKQPKPVAEKALPAKQAELPVDESLKDKIEEEKVQALSLFEEGEYDKSLDKWNSLIEISPQDAQIYNNLGVVFKKMGKSKEASENYKKALELNSDYPEALNNMGILMIESYDFDAAHSHFDRAIELNSQYAEPHFHLGALNEKEGDFALAVKHYESFLDLSQDLPAELRRKVDLRIEILRARSIQEAN